MPRLVLASTSPFRKAILEKLAIPFEVSAPQVDESALADEAPAQLVERLACAKARKVADAFTDALIIGSDQVAVIDDRILGKPGNHAKAHAQLQQAAGKSVTFLTGLCLYNTATGQHQSEVVPFQVVFRELTEQQIENYLRAETPYNCAGSFNNNIGSPHPEALGSALTHPYVTTDFSDELRRALAAAASLASKFSAELHVVHAAQIPPVMISPWPEVDTSSG